MSKLKQLKQKKTIMIKKSLINHSLIQLNKHSLSFLLTNLRLKEYILILFINYIYFKSVRKKKK